MFTGVESRYLFEQLTSTDLTKKKRKKKKIRISQIRILEYYCKQMSNTKFTINILSIKCRLKIKI